MFTNFEELDRVMKSGDPQQIEELCNRYQKYAKDNHLEFTYDEDDEDDEDDVQENEEYAILDDGDYISDSDGIYYVGDDPDVYNCNM